VGGARRGSEGEGAGARGTEGRQRSRKSKAGERRRKETDIKRETEDVGFGRRLATGGGTA